MVIRMNIAPKPYIRRMLLPVKLVLLVILTWMFRNLDTKADGETAYTIVNLIMLGCIWSAVLLPRAVWSSLPAKIVSCLFLAAVPGVHLLLVELLMPRTRDIVTKMLYLNIIFYYLAFLFLLFLFRRHSPLAVLSGTVVAWLCGTVNCVAWQYRSLPVLPWDLYSTKTALSVAADYQFTFTHLFWSVQLAFLCIAVLGFRLRLPYVIPSRIVHWALTAVSAGALCGFILFLQTDTVFTDFGGYRYLFTPTVYYERNGAAVSFLSTLHYLNVDRPDGYDADEIAEQAKAYAETEDDAAAEADEYPNIIVIMNEAFSDLRALCEYSTNLPVTPNIDALTENTIKGNLHVSVKGGNTANTEYEFLTGDTMAFLPAGSIPYQQHIKSEVPGLTSHLKALGYQTEAVHPYYASGWMRNQVYPWFSFDTASFIDAFQPLYSSDILRGYVSDKTLFSYLIERCEENRSSGSDAPLFLFAVTMQNHGSYDKEYDNFIPDVTVDGIEEYKRISAYLSLIRKTDQYFASLIDYFSKTDDKTVILMFGDHQPNDNVVSTLMGNSGVDNSAEALDAYNRYITPYVLWANYDIDTEAVEEVFSTQDISANYLSSLLCTAAGIPLSGYQSFLASIEKQYPVITAKTILDGETGTLYESDNLDLLQEKEPLLSLYRSFSYNHIFDQKNLIPDFFD